MNDNQNEYQFARTQLNNNNLLKMLVENDISQLLIIVHQKRHLIKQIEEQNRELTNRINAMSGENNQLVFVDYLSFNTDLGN